MHFKIPFADLVILECRLAQQQVNIAPAPDMFFCGHEAIAVVRLCLPLEVCVCCWAGAFAVGRARLPFGYTS